MKSKHRNQKCGLLKIVLGGPKVNEVRTALRRAIKVSGKVDFALPPSEKKGSLSIFLNHTEARARITKEQARKMFLHNQDFQLLRSRGQGYSLESIDWYSNNIDDSSTSWYDWQEQVAQLRHRDLRVCDDRIRSCFRQHQQRFVPHESMEWGSNSIPLGTCRRFSPMFAPSGGTTSRKSLRAKMRSLTQFSPLRSVINFVHIVLTKPQASRRSFHRV